MDEDEVEIWGECDDNGVIVYPTSAWDYEDGRR